MIECLFYQLQHANVFYFSNTPVTMANFLNLQKIQILGTIEDINQFDHGYIDFFMEKL